MPRKRPMLWCKVCVYVHYELVCALTVIFPSLRLPRLSALKTEFLANCTRCALKAWKSLCWFPQVDLMSMRKDAQIPKSFP